VSDRVETRDHERRGQKLRGDTLKEVAQVFLLLGFVGFGGPAAHVALMRREIVQRRRWVEEKEFLEMYAACNLIPGPSSTELAIFLGYRRAGWRAMLLAGVLFILPAMLIMLGIAWAYTHYRSTTGASAIFYGLRPVIVAVILWALVDLAGRVLRRPLSVLISVGALGLAMLGVYPLLVLAAAAVAVLAAETSRKLPSSTAPALLPIGGYLLDAGWPELSRLPLVFLTFLKIGAISYGSGYVLLAFLHADFVANLHWLSDKQLLDAVALGQATPGPVFTTATFLGYLFAGLPGALLATIGIFLPGFVFVPFLQPLVRLARERSSVGSMLDGVNAGVLGLIAAVTLQIGRAAVVDLATVLIVVVSFAILRRWPLSSPALIAGGAGLGVLLRLVL
jgi:chromate transporter